MSTKKISEVLSGNRYPGRIIIIGKTFDGKVAIAYAIMGRSENSRNRIFKIEGERDVYTKAFDESKVSDPSLIIYSAVRYVDGGIIVTNGDQTDTVRDGLAEGRSFSEALSTRTFEPDAPNYTPRISGLVTYADGDFDYQMSILRCPSGDGVTCSRDFYKYEGECGVGHIIHTYASDGDPLPSFVGEPIPIEIPQTVEEFTHQIWDSLDRENRISLYTMTLDIKTNEFRPCIINKNDASDMTAL